MRNESIKEIYSLIISDNYKITSTDPEGLSSVYKNETNKSLG